MNYVYFGIKSLENFVVTFDVDYSASGFVHWWWWIHSGTTPPPSLKEILKYVSKLTKRRIGYVHLYRNKILTTKMPLSTLPPPLKYATSGTRILQSNLD